jgi:hypothetical protein
MGLGMSIPNDQLNSCDVKNKKSNEVSPLQSSQD